VAAVRIGLSSSCLYPLPVGAAFATASRLGYDGLEVMVTTEPVTQRPDSLARLVDQHGIPVLATHAPTLLITQRVWGHDPWEKIDRSIELAVDVGAPTVVIHPPFRWQRAYAEEFVEGIARRERDSGLYLAVENMYPWRAVGQTMQAYLPDFRVVGLGYPSTALDFSHSAASGDDAMEMAVGLASSLRHVHLGDGSGSSRDEHLVPGRGNQPCGPVLDYLKEEGFTGDVIVEVSTRNRTRDQRDYDLAESLAFARLHLLSGMP